MNIEILMKEQEIEYLWWVIDNSNIDNEVILAIHELKVLNYCNVKEKGE